MTNLSACLGAAAVSAIAIACAQPALAGRYEQLTDWAAKGPKMQVRAATFFGSAGAEGFVDAVQAKDGTILAVGNAYGPGFAESPPPAVIGEGAFQNSDPFVTDPKSNSRKLKPYTRDMCGFLAYFAPDGRKAICVARFNWGVATFRTAELSNDGKALIVSGFCDAAALRKVASKARHFETHVRPAAAAADASKRGRAAPAPAPCYVMRVALGPEPAAKPFSGEQIEWCWVLDGCSAAPEPLWQDKDGNVYYAVDGFTKISADGAKLTKITEKGTTGGQSGYRGIDPADGCAFFGGDRNTNTGHQPWRSPFLYKYDANGNKVTKLWEWNPKTCACGGDGNGLCSDSSPRMVKVLPTGDMLVVGWSDGGNSVFTRQPLDLNKGAGASRGPFTTHGMKSANSLCYLLRIDSKTYEQKAWSYWMAYVPDCFGDVKFRGAPNGIGIEDIEGLGGGCSAFLGGSATGLISTPDAFFKYTGPAKYGGRYVAVISDNFSNLFFSSYLPGYETDGMAATKKGVVVVGTTRKDDGRSDQKPTPPPVVNALQPQFAGGEFDGHLIVLEFESM